jgi:hypothetical protein
MEMAGEEPDSIIACCGGGSNFAGLAFPFIHKKITEKKKYRIVGVEPSACPSLTKGELRYDFGDTAEMTPLLMMYTLGHKFMPPSIHSGGLRYHGMSPMVSHALKLGLIEAQAYHQTKVFEAGILFRADGRHCAGAGIRARDRRGRGRSRESPRGGQEARHAVQSVRPRPARPERVRDLPHRQDAGCLTLNSNPQKNNHENSNSIPRPGCVLGGAAGYFAGPTLGPLCAGLRRHQRRIAAAAGVYVRDYNYFYWAGPVERTPPAIKLGIPGFDAFTYANIPRVIWITDTKFLGGYVGVDALLPLC